MWAIINTLPSLWQIGQGMLTGASCITIASDLIPLHWRQMLPFQLLSDLGIPVEEALA
tara:strand:+ start:323 stop:496 length:174 start_codon:yes stop_codon:yes gene_type:complete